MRKTLSEVLVFGLLLILASGARAQDQSVRHVVLRAGRILDVKTGHVLTDQAIVIDGDKIVSVGPSAGAKVAAGGTVIDLPDATVLVLQGLTFVVLLVSEMLYGRFKIFQVQGTADRT